MDVLLLEEQEVTDMGHITCDWLICVTNVPDICLVLAVLPEREVACEFHDAHVTHFRSRSFLP